MDKVSAGLKYEDITITYGTGLSLNSFNIENACGGWCDDETYGKY
jgi:hypothetical protein